MAGSDADIGPMSARRRSAVVVLASGLLAGCGSATPAVRVGTPALARSRALTFAQAVNLKPDDLPGFAGVGTETEPAAAGPIDLAQDRCTGVLGSSMRVAKVASPEFSAGHGLHAEILKSTVEVWPTAHDVVFNSVRSETRHGEGCLRAALRAVRRKINMERGGRMLIGPSTIAAVPDPLPGVSRSSLLKIDETRLHRSGAVFFHVYRDIFGFVTGPSEVELEAVGFGHPVPARTERRALRSLVGRATANAGSLGSGTSS